MRTPSAMILCTLEIFLTLSGCSTEGPGEFGVVFEDAQLFDLGVSDFELQVTFFNESDWDVEDFFFEVEMYAQDTPLRSTETSERATLLRAAEIPASGRREGAWNLEGYEGGNTARLRLLSAYDANSGAAYCDEDENECETIACLDDVAPCESLQ
jgi:hypothetical protein